MGMDHDALDALAIETPCTQPWEDMRGDDRVRHCNACRLDVHDLSALTRTEADALLAQTTGRICARIHRRPDGRVLTRDCAPVRRRQERRRSRARVALAGLLALVGLGGCRGQDEGTVTVGVVAPESYEVQDAPSPVPPQGASSKTSCGAN